MAEGSPIGMRNTPPAWLSVDPPVVSVESSSELQAAASSVIETSTTASRAKLPLRRIEWTSLTLSGAHGAGEPGRA